MTIRYIRISKLDLIYVYTDRAPQYHTSSYEYLLFIWSPLHPEVDDGSLKLKKDRTGNMGYGNKDVYIFVF